MENLDLKEIRNKLDEIDTQLVGLFEKRMALCSDVAEFKIQTGKKVYDGERERQKLEAVTVMVSSVDIKQLKRLSIQATYEAKYEKRD